jgi:citrate synthase
MLNTRVNEGLDGVVVADTALSHVDGEAGRLVVRGRELPELVRDEGFEGTAALLWHGLLPGPDDRAAVAAALGRARVHAFAHVQRLQAASAGLSAVEALRAGLALLSEQDPMPPHLLVCGAMPVFLAASLRQAKGLAPVPPDATLGTAADLLRMLRGERAAAHFEAALDAYFTTVADHGFNASTFTARVIASTRAGMLWAVLGALCALRGPLHGGAPGPVLDMLDEIGGEAGIDGWLDRTLDSGQRLMGFGHRVYKVRDPRADVLKAVVGGLPRTAGRLAFAGEVERRVLAELARRKPGQRLHTNVEFHTALLLEALDLPRDSFTALFAVARAAGWCAHVAEQEKRGRIIRPQSNYVGPWPAPA